MGSGSGEQAKDQPVAHGREATKLEPESKYYSGEPMVKLDYKTTAIMVAEEAAEKTNHTGESKAAANAADGKMEDSAEVTKLIKDMRLQEEQQRGLEKLTDSAEGPDGKMEDSAEVMNLVEDMRLREEQRCQLEKIEAMELVEDTTTTTTAAAAAASSGPVSSSFTDPPSLHHDDILTQHQIQPLPNLRRDAHRYGRRTPNQPGAYSNIPGGLALRLQPFSPSDWLSSNMSMVSSQNSLHGHSPTNSVATQATTGSTTNAHSPSPGTTAASNDNDHHNHNQGLVEARLVTDEQDPPIVISIAEEERKSPTPTIKNRNGYRCISCSLLLVVALGVMASFAFIIWWCRTLPKEKGGDNGVNLRPTGTNDDLIITTSSFIQSRLPKQTRASLQDPQSPQSKAFQWLQNDPQLLSYPKERLLQRFALVTFYLATNGKTWILNNDWLSYELHECQWLVTPGFADLFHTNRLDMPPCEEEFYHHNKSTSSSSLRANTITTVAGVYRRLWMVENNVSGTIPEEIFLLSNLESFNVHMNWNIMGTISTKFCALTNLRELNLAVNQFSGTIPTELGLLTQLTYLSIRGQFVGEKLHGTIPTELGLLTELQRLGISKANVTGPIPTELFRLTKLMSFDSIDSYISGTLPSEFGLFTDLVFAWMFKSKYTGVIPSEFGNLSRLAWLNLSQNKLSGPIPSEIGGLESIQELSLADNYLSSSLPTELNSLQRMYQLDLSKNNLAGSIPAFNLSAITCLQLSHNALFGVIPSQFGLLGTLEGLDLSHNLLVSSIPSELGNLPALREVYLHENFINGSLPRELAGLQMLQVWNSANNHLSGEFPEEYSRWPNLTSFNVIGNQLLSGLIPPELRKLNESLSSLECSSDLCK